MKQMISVKTLLRDLAVFITLFLLSAVHLQAQELTFKGRLWGCETGGGIALGAYKTYASTFILLDRKRSTPILESEAAAFRWLIPRFIRPRYLIIQGTLYPLATVSSYLETFHVEEFNRFKVGGLNLLRAVGSGKEEPYDLSLFLGNFAFTGYYVRQDSTANLTPRQSGSLLAGLLFTTGHWHIHDNIRVDDWWWQIELVLTGNLREPNVRKANWNFRVGTKLHANRLVPDVALITLHRSHTDWHYKGFSLFRNSRFLYEAHFPIGGEWRRSPFTIRQLISYGKKFPFRIFGRFVAVRLGGGVLWEWVRLYDYEKREFEPEEKGQLIWLIQPSVEF